MIKSYKESCILANGGSLKFCKHKARRSMGIKTERCAFRSSTAVLSVLCLRQMHASREKERERDKETVSKRSRRERRGLHYVCKSDSALNKILTDQSNMEVGKGRREEREKKRSSRTRVSLRSKSATFFPSPVNTLPLFVTFCV